MYYVGFTNIFLTKFIDPKSQKTVIWIREITKKYLFLNHNSFIRAPLICIISGDVDEFSAVSFQILMLFQVNSYQKDPDPNRGWKGCDMGTKNAKSRFNVGWKISQSRSIKIPGWLLSSFGAVFFFHYVNYSVKKCFNEWFCSYQ